MQGPAQPVEALAPLDIPPKLAGLMQLVATPGLPAVAQAGIIRWSAGRLR